MGHTNSAFSIRILASIASLAGLLGSAEPAQLVVRPYGTNQLQLTATSLQTNAPYMVLARTNRADAHWSGLTWIFPCSNSTATVLYNLSDASQSPGLKGLAIHNLARWTFAIGSGNDSDGNGLPDVYEELVMRSDPYSGADPYADPDGDGWSNLQEFQNGTDPLRFDQPPPPSNVNARRSTNGTVIVTWSCWNGGAEYWIVEKALRTLQRNTNLVPFLLQPPSPLNRTNTSEYLARQRQFQPRYGPAWNQRYHPAYVTGPFEVVAQVRSKPDQHDYSFTETNVADNPLSGPVYRVQAHYTVPPRAYLNHVNITTIRGTILTVTAHQTTNGYDLVALHPIPYGWYLLLVRDGGNPQWRASGYFTAGTNREPVYLHVDAKGMMHEGQGPTAMPEVHFLSDIVAPEFTAGWGEDSDGDGLPDIYEVLVTRTDPANADTGDTGTLDGYKEPAHDGWSNLEKFRRRANPFEPILPPPAVELRRPTLMQIWQALDNRALKTDLHYEPQLAIRKPGEATFRPMDQDLQMWDYAANLRDPTNAHLDFDLRIELRPPQPHPQDRGYSGP